MLLFALFILLLLAYLVYFNPVLRKDGSICYQAQILLKGQLATSEGDMRSSLYTLRNG